MKNILRFYIRACLFLFPVIFLPIVTDSFVFGKGWFLMISALLGLLVWVGVLLEKKKVVVKVSGVLWWFLGLLIWSLFSWLRLSVGARMSSMVGPFGFGTVLALFVWVFLWLQVREKEEEKKQMVFVTVAGALVVLSSLLTFLLPESRLPFLWPKENPIISINNTWSLTGSLLAELVLLIFLAIINGRDLLKKLKEERQGVAYLTDTVKTAFLTLGVCLSFYKLFKFGFGWLDLKSSWVIAVETFKNTPLFGVGIGNFIKAFRFSRPASYNLTRFWNVGFAVSGMGLLHIWTELGLVGLVLVLTGIVKLLKKKGFGLFLGLVLMVFLLPFNLISLWLLVLLLVNRWSGVKKIRIDLFLGEERKNIVLISLSFLVLVLAGGGVYYSGKFLLSEIYLKKSFVFISENNGGEA
ncbi:hypothetical protein KKC08_04940, partial [Patescibacteria group bacterium]|nr:hypothetical protein [Patescibacteria group bacterium]